MLVMSIVYAVLNYFLVFNTPWYIFAGLAASALGSYAFSKFNRQTLAKLFGLINFNVIIYCVASSESQPTNINLYFATAGTAALVLFNPTKTRLAFVFIGMSFMLYMAAIHLPYSPLEHRTFSSGQLFFISLVNVLVFAYVTTYLVVLLLRSNFRKKENLKKQNRILLKVNKELDRFTYSASHDLRAPISSVLGLLNLSEAEKSEEQRGKYLQMMRKQMESMDRFIRSIMDYSKNINQKIELTEIVVGEQIQEAFDELRFMDGASEMDFLCEGIDRMVIRTDVTRLRIILSNLISNAIKYRDTNKERQSLTIRASQEGQQLKIEFLDNGIGIPPAYHAKIMDMFFRAHATSTGSGLGLYITRETLATMGGSIQFTSEAGKGSTFTIALPA